MSSAIKTEAVMTSASVHCQAIGTLHEIGIAFQHGHVVHPLGCLAQVLWFRLESSLTHQGRIPSITCYWIEEAGGPLRVIRLSDLECRPEQLLPSLAALPGHFPDDDALTERLRAAWLVPPHFRANQPKHVSIIHVEHVLRGAIMEQIAAMLATHTLPEPVAKKLEQALDAFDVQDPDRHKYVPDRYLQDYVDVEFLIPEEVEEFLSAAKSFRAMLDGEVVSLLKYHSEKFAKADTVENYNLITSWSGAVRRNRLQAITAFPWLFHDLGLKTGGPEYFHQLPKNVPAVADIVLPAIDQGQRLLPVLAKHYQVRQGTLRRARTLHKLKYVCPEKMPAFLWQLAPRQ